MFSKIPTDFNPKSTYINYPVIPHEQHGNHELVSFNPRTREGATHQLIWHVPQRNSFNPRTREGAALECVWKIIPKISCKL